MRRNLWDYLSSLQRHTEHRLDVLGIYLEKLKRRRKVNRTEISLTLERVRKGTALLAKIEAVRLRERERFELEAYGRKVKLLMLHVKHSALCQPERRIG